MYDQYTHSRHTRCCLALPRSPLCLCSREEVKTKWSVSDFIRAFIKFHGHVYLSRSVDKLDALRERLEEHFQVRLRLLHAGLPSPSDADSVRMYACVCMQRLILQKAFSSQQLVHITIINLFELHHLTADSEQSCSSEHQTSWSQLLGLFSKMRTHARPHQCNHAAP